MSFLSYLIYNYAFLFESRSWSAFLSVDIMWIKVLSSHFRQSRHTQTNQTQGETFHITDISAGGSRCTVKLQVSFCYKQPFKQPIFFYWGKPWKDFFFRHTLLLLGCSVSSKAFKCFFIILWKPQLSCCKVPFFVSSPPTWAQGVVN